MHGENKFAKNKQIMQTNDTKVFNQEYYIHFEQSMNSSKYANKAQIE